MKTPDTIEHPFLPFQSFREKQIASLNKPVAEKLLLQWLDIVLAPKDVSEISKVTLRIMLALDKTSAVLAGNGDLVKPLTDDERKELWIMNNRLRSNFQSNPVTEEEKEKLIAKCAPLAKRGMFNL